MHGDLRRAKSSGRKPYQKPKIVCSSTLRVYDSGHGICKTVRVEFIIQTDTDLLKIETSISFLRKSELLF